MTKEQLKAYECLRKEKETLEEKMDRFSEIEKCISYDPWGMKEFYIGAYISDSDDGRSDYNQRRFTVFLTIEEVKDFIDKHKQKIKDEIIEIDEEIERI